MKKYLNIFTVLLMLTECVLGYDKIYIQRNPYPIYNSYNYCYPNCYINRPFYNPYWVQKNVNYVRDSSSKAKRLQRTRRIEKLRNYTNQLSWLNNSNQGSLTGYSVPVTKDIYKQMGITPYNPSNKVRINSPTCNQELFSAPSGNEMYYNNGRRYGDLRGTSTKTGVTIIYD